MGKYIIGKVASSGSGSVTPGHFPSLAENLWSFNKHRRQLSDHYTTQSFSSMWKAITQVQEPFTNWQHLSTQYFTRHVYLLWSRFKDSLTTSYQLHGTTVSLG